MTRDEEKIRDFLKNSLDPIHAHDGIYSKVMLRMQETKKKGWNFYFFLKRVVPLTLVLVLMMGILFPVFGKEGSLVDLYNSYQVHRSLKSLRDNETNQGENNLRDQSIGSFYLNSLLEKEYGVEPESLLQIKAQNPDDLETVALLVISKLSSQTPEDLILLRKQNISWGRILSFYRINPKDAVMHIAALRQKIVSSMERRFIVRGQVDSINENTGIFYISGIPFPIQITLDTEKPENFTAGTMIAAEVIDYGDSQNIQVLYIKILQEEKAGFAILRGEVLQRDENSILLQLFSDRTKVKIRLSPRIMDKPNQIFLRSGTMVHVEVSLKKNEDGSYTAFAWGKMIPLPRNVRERK